MTIGCKKYKANTAREEKVNKIRKDRDVSPQRWRRWQQDDQIQVHTATETNIRRSMAGKKNKAPKTFR